MLLLYYTKTKSEQCKQLQTKLTQKGGFCFMENTMTLNKTIRESLALALIRLLQKKDFSEITVSEIVKTAGVSRSSFYRNFESKEQLLLRYLYDLYADFFGSGEVLAQIPEYNGMQDFLLPRFRFIKDHHDLFLVLRKHNLLYYAFEQLENDLIHLLTGYDSSLPDYCRAMFSGSCAGIIRMWIDHDFRESEEEMIQFFTYYREFLRY